MTGEKGQPRPETIKLQDADNVVVALRTLTEGETVDGVPGPLRQRVPRGHKVACRPIARGSSR